MTLDACVSQVIPDFLLYANEGSLVLLGWNDCQAAASGLRRLSDNRFQPRRFPRWL